MQRRSPPPDEENGQVISKACQKIAGDFEAEVVSEGIRKGMFVIEDWIRANPQITFDSLLNNLIPDATLRQSVKNSFVQDSINLANGGIAQYVERKYEQGIFSAIMKDTILLMKSQFEAFVHSSHPTLEQTIQFWNDKLTIWNAFLGCSGEKRALKLYAASAIGFARYYYASRQEASSSGATGSISFRACDTFWEGLACGTLSLVAGVATTVLVSELVVAGFAAGGITCSVLGNTAPPELCGDILGVITGFVVGRAVFRWCCSWFRDDVPVCRNPQSYGYRVLACNQYEVSAFGAGSAVAAYVWNNTNTQPDNAVTTVPFLAVSIPNPGQPSIIQARILCSNGTEVSSEPFSQEIIFSSGQPGVLGWAVAPPATASVGQTVSVAISASGIAFPYQLSWSTSFGGGVTPTGTHTASVHFWASGSVTITATLTNTCSGQSVNISRTVSIKP